MKSTPAMLTLTFALMLAALAPNAALAQALIDGTVTKVDAATSKITIRHGPIEKFDGKAGDKVKFDADNVDGQFIVTKIEKAK
jgi:Cu/Ag efflux protein CusF